MAKAKLDDEQSFTVQEQRLPPSRQPLKVHHLSHDLRGPLNSILGFAELLKEGIEGPINEIQAEDLAAIHQSASNLLHTINAIVDLSKLENDRLILTFEPVQLDAIVEHVVLSLNKRVDADQIDLFLNIPESLPPIWGDRDRVEQMVLSLARFITTIMKSGRIDFNIHYDEKNVTIEIVTNKDLLPPEQLEELFELIVEVSADGRTHLGPGGLALPLTYQLAKKQAGQVWVESLEEAGTTFYVRLPLIDQLDG